MPEGSPPALSRAGRARELHGAPRWVPDEPGKSSSLAPVPRRRARFLSTGEGEFRIGEGSLRIIIHHILPNTLSYVIVAFTLSIPAYILGESGLSLIGLGIQEPYASWGNLLSEPVNNLTEITFHPWILIPGLFIFIAVMAFNFLGDGLRDAFDPRTAFEGK